MQDLETKSLWSQISGICIQGEMEGAKLKQVPSSHTTFAAFKEQYPNGKLLKKPADSPSGSTYDSYYADKDKLGIFGRVDNFKRLKGKDKVFGLRFESGEVAVSEKYLIENRSAKVISGSDTIYVHYDPETSSVTAYEYPVNIAMSAPGKIDMSTISGETYPIISAYWFAWVSFFPETELIK